MQLLWLPLSIFYFILFLNVYSSNDRLLYDCSIRETLSYDAVIYLLIYKSHYSMLYFIYMYIYLLLQFCNSL